MADLTVNKAIEKLLGLRAAIRDALLTECAGAAREIISQSVHQNVYDVYPEHFYPRREDEGGLSDIRNYKAEVYESGDVQILEIKNETPFQAEVQSNISLSHVVQTGDKRFGMPFKRPYMENAQAEVEQIAKALVLAGLKRQGLV